MSISAKAPAFGDRPSQTFGATSAATFSAATATARFIVAAGVVVGVTALAWPHLPRRYEASASLVLQPDSVDAAEGTARQVLDDAEIQSEIDRIGSGGMVARLLERTDPAGVADLSAPGPAEEVLRRVATFAEDRGHEAGWLWQPKPPLSQARLTQRLRERILVERDHHGNTLKLTVWSADPAEAASWANTLTDLYMTDQVARKHVALEAEGVRLRARVDALRTLEAASEGAVVSFLDRSGLISQPSLAADETRVANLTEDVEQAHSAFTETQARAAERPSSAAAAPQNAFSLLDPKPTQEDADRLFKRMTTLQGELATAQAQLGQRRHDEIHLEALRRTAATDAAALADATAKVAASLGRAEVVGPDAQVISAGDAPEVPAFPDPRRTAAGSAMLALLAGAVAAWRPWRRRPVSRGAGAL